MPQKYGFDLVPIQRSESIAALQKANDFSQKFGLVLNDAEISALTERRFESLKSVGRVEFGEGILPKIIYTFADSPYLMKDNYFTMLDELQDCFYYYKNENCDVLSDDEMLSLMRRLFDNKAEGVIYKLCDLLTERFCGFAEETEKADEEGNE